MKLSAKSAVLLLLSVLLLAAAAVSQANEHAPYAPPPAPERPAAEPSEHSAAGLSPLLYLPLVQSPLAPPSWVDTASRSAVQALYAAEYLGTENAEAGWSGSHDGCSPGDTSAAFKEAMRRRINYFRSMAGVPAVAGLNSEYNRKAQAAALMMSVNGRLSHTPDESWTCYSNDGREGAGSSNLYLGVYGPAAISGYIYDPGGGNYFVGHRRWILYPPTRYMGTGDIPPSNGRRSANALWVFDRDNMWGPRPDTREAYVAWPPPGFVPFQVVYPRWSFSYPQADFSAAVVTMSQGGQPIPVVTLQVYDGYGDNTLVWEPEVDFSQPPAADTTYQVSIANVKIDDAPHQFDYAVTLFQP